MRNNPSDFFHVSLFSTLYENVQMYKHNTIIIQEKGGTSVLFAVNDLFTFYYGCHK